MQNTDIKLLRHLAWLLKKGKIKEFNAQRPKRIIARNLHIKIDFRGSNFNYSNFRGSNFRGSDFRGSDFSDSNFSDSNFSDSDFRGSDLSEINMSNCILHKNTLFLDFAGIGSEKRRTIILFKKGYHTAKVFCGCFKGNLREFEKQIRETYETTDLKHKQYMIMLKAIKEQIKLYN